MTTDWHTAGSFANKLWRRWTTASCASSTADCRKVRDPKCPVGGVVVFMPQRLGGGSQNRENVDRTKRTEVVVPDAAQVSVASSPPPHPRQPHWCVVWCGQTRVLRVCMPSAVA